MSEMTKEQAIQNMEKSVELLINIQWDLKNLETLASPVRQALLEVAMYYLNILMMVDPLRTMGLANRLLDARADREANELISGTEEFLKNHSQDS